MDNKGKVAFTSHAYSPSYVLTAMGLDSDRIASVIRICWDVKTEKDELLRNLSSLLDVANGLAF